MRKLAVFIDDDPDFLEALVSVVEHPAFEIDVLVVENGYRAIDEVIRKKPDVLFIDFNLPRANGGQILAVLKGLESFRETPVFFMTGHSADEVLPLLEGLQYEGLLKKSDTFADEVREVLNSLGRSGGSPHSP